MIPQGCRKVCAKDQCVGNGKNPLPKGELWETRQKDATNKGCCVFAQGPCDICCPPGGHGAGSASSSSSSDAGSGGGGEVNKSPETVAEPVDTEQEAEERCEGKKTSAECCTDPFVCGWVGEGLDECMTPETIKFQQHSSECKE